MPWGFLLELHGWSVLTLVSRDHRIIRVLTDIGGIFSPGLALISSLSWWSF